MSRKTLLTRHTFKGLPKAKKTLHAKQKITIQDDPLEDREDDVLAGLPGTTVNVSKMVRVHNAMVGDPDQQRIDALRTKLENTPKQSSASRIWCMALSFLLGFLSCLALVGA